MTGSSPFHEGEQGVQTRLGVSRRRHADVIGRDYDTAGRVDGALLEKLVPGLDADFCLCGPRGFMAAIGAQLGARGVSTERIRTESFGGIA